MTEEGDLSRNIEIAADAGADIGKRRRARARQGLDREFFRVPI
jgi:hypothetical protein